MKPTISFPLVSIVTPSYNQARYLEKTICSVLDQDYPNIEYIIVDGGSKDVSKEIILRYASRLAWWVSEPDKGHADALNKGFAHAKGEILAWLNSDDTYLPGAVSEAVGFLQDHPEVAMVYGDANLIDSQGHRLGRFASRQTDYKKMLRGSVHIPQAATFFRATAWSRVGPLDTTIYYAFDYDFWVRLAKEAPLQYVPKPWANFRIHNDSKTILADDRCYPDMLRVLQREGGSWLSWLRLRYLMRTLFYSWLPLRLRVWLRRVLII